MADQIRARCNWKLLLACCFLLVGFVKATDLKAAGDPEEEPGDAGAESAHQGSPTQVDRAFGAYQRGYYLTAFDLALPRAENGDPAAQTLIAEMYERGLGVGKNTGEAAAWYEIAAEAGNREAQFAFGIKLMQGKDVAQDKERGIEMMRRAADAGHPVAMFNYANHIVDIRPTSAGYRQALPYFEGAAEQGLGDAFYALSLIYSDGLADGIQNPELGRKWLIRAARTGIDTAQLDLALDLIRGENGPKDEKAAYAWFRIAATSGNVIAQNRLSHMLAAGIGVKQSRVEAAKWHIIASRAGRADLELDKFVASLDAKSRQKALELANQWPIRR